MKENTVSFLGRKQKLFSELQQENKKLNKVLAASTCFIPVVLQSLSKNKHIFNLRRIIRVIIAGGGSYLQAPMESLSES